MKNKKLFLVSTLTAMLFALSGCGGESANVIPEKNDSSTESGSCSGDSTSCVKFALDYPLDGLNFYCGTDTDNTYLTKFDLNEGVASGACKTGDDITFFLQGAEKHKIELGKFSLNDVGTLSVSQMPRLSILDIAKGINKTGTGTPTLTDERVAERLIRIIQTIGLNVNPPQSSAALSSSQDIQPIIINDSVRTNLDKLLADITVSDIKNTTDAQFEELLSKWIDISVVQPTDANKVLKKLLNITNAAVYQPEFSLFSTTDSLTSYLSGSEGLSGCEVGKSCAATTADVEHIFGHFMLMTDRQGRTFGSGLQWRGIATSPTQGTIGFETIGGLNAQLIRQYAPIQMTAEAQTSWIQDSTKQIPNDPGFKFVTKEDSAQTMKIYQGRLYNDYMIAGTEKFYKILTGKKTDAVLTSNEKNELGLWKQEGSDKSYAGSMDLYKIYPISYLDRRIFKTKDNVQTGTNYIFPLYANLVFKFTDTSVNQQVLPIVIDENGDIRTNFRPNGATVDECSATFDNEAMISNFAGLTEKQYPIGTASRAFVASSGTQATDNSLSIRMILGGSVFDNLDGALVGMNSTIKASTSTTDEIRIGGALLKLQNLLSPQVSLNEVPSNPALVDSSGATVKWANSFASFNKVYNTQNPSDNASKENAKRAGGDLKLELASCYRVKVK